MNHAHWPCVPGRRYACIVDVSPAGEDGTGFGKSMGVFLAVALLALLLGPVVGGVIAAVTSNEVAFFAAGIASVVSAAYVAPRGARGCNDV